MSTWRTIGLGVLALGVGTSGCVTGSEKKMATAAGANAASGAPSNRVLVDFSAEIGPRPIGRAMQTKTGAIQIAWSGTGAALRFHGTSLSVEITDTGDNHYLVLLDGTPFEEKIRPAEGRNTIEIAADLREGEHTAVLYKLTEPLVGTATIHGFVLSPRGRALPYEIAPKKRIEILGDSISAGYGNEGADETCGFSPDTENHYLTFGAIAARKLDAELVTIAWSGKGVFTNRGSETDTDVLPDLWDQTLPAEKVPYEFDGPAPDAVIINLGTNDFAPEVPDFSPFGPAYEAFVETVRTRYPAAHLLLMMGPLLTDGYPEGRKAYTTARAALHQIVERRTRAGDDKVHFFEVTRATPEEGFGCDWHPSIKTHNRMAQELVLELRTKAGF